MSNKDTGGAMKNNLPNDDYPDTTQKPPISERLSKDIISPNMTFSQLAAKLLYSFGSDCANNKVVADRFLEPTLKALTAAHNKAVLEAVDKIANINLNYTIDPVSQLTIHYLPDSVIEKIKHSIKQDKEHNNVS